MNLTPAMRQYLEIKEQHKDCILFFRMGDFYEMFFEDAITASKILEITLTSRNRGKEDSIPLCGIPYHAASTYIAKLIEKGFKVAICEQTEDPREAKGVVKRDVVRIITPALFVNEDNTNIKENAFLMALALTGRQVRPCFPRHIYRGISGHGVSEQGYFHSGNKRSRFSQSHHRGGLS